MVELKPSVPAAEAVSTLLESEPGMTLKQLAFDLHISEFQASHLKNNWRSMQQDIAKQALKTYDNFEFTLRLAHLFPRGQHPRYLMGQGGKSIELRQSKMLSEKLWMSLTNLMLNV